MKKAIYMLLAPLALLGALTSCDKDTEGVTRVTYYATLVVDGPSKMMVTVGDDFVDPGYSAELDGKDVTDDVVVTSDLDTDVPGYYTIVYTYTNADGFSSSGTRYVLVTDPDDKMAGFYTVQTDSYREYNGGEVYYGGYPLIVIGDGEGSYEIDDLLGGWYCYRAGYGTSYAMWGQLSLEADNSLTLDYSYVPGWGDTAESFTGSFDPTTGTLSWVVEYTDYPFFFHVNAVKD